MREAIREVIREAIREVIREVIRSERSSEVIRGSSERESGRTFGRQSKGNQRSS